MDILIFWDFLSFNMGFGFTFCGVALYLVFIFIMLWSYCYVCCVFTTCVVCYVCFCFIFIIIIVIILCGFLVGPSLINAGHILSCTVCVDIQEQWMTYTKEYGMFCPLSFLFYFLRDS